MKNSAKPMPWSGFFLAGCLAVAGCGRLAVVAISARDLAAIPPVAISGARMPATAIPAIFNAPEGKGPFPAVLVAAAGAVPASARGPAG